jgi:hypothetical protein
MGYGDIQWFVVTGTNSKVQVQFDQMAIPEDSDDPKNGLTVTDKK